VWKSLAFYALYLNDTVGIGAYARAWREFCRVQYSHPWTLVGYASGFSFWLIWYIQVYKLGISVATTQHSFCTRLYPSYLIRTNPARRRISTDTLREVVIGGMGHEFE